MTLSASFCVTAAAAAATATAATCIFTSVLMAAVTFSTAVRFVTMVARTTLHFQNQG